MKAIYIGLTKTGTKTMRSVFARLGFKFVGAEEHVNQYRKQFLKLLDEEITPEFLREMYKGVDAIVEPAFLYWEELLTAFPDVKVMS